MVPVPEAPLIRDARAGRVADHPATNQADRAGNDRASQGAQGSISGPLARGCDGWRERDAGGHYTRPSAMKARMLSSPIDQNGRLPAAREGRISSIPILN